MLGRKLSGMPLLAKHVDVAVQAGHSGPAIDGEDGCEDHGREVIEG